MPATRSMPPASARIAREISSGDALDSPGTTLDTALLDDHAARLRDQTLHLVVAGRTAPYELARFAVRRLDPFVRMHAVESA
jgi:hypothetical protein